MEKLTKGSVSQHVVLYAKNHYVETEVISDLKFIISGIAGLTRELISIDMIYDVVGKTFSQVVEEGDKDNFILKLFDWEGEITRLKAMSEMLGYIQGVVVFDDQGTDILGLGDPDPGVLPLRNDNREEV